VAVHATALLLNPLQYNHLPFSNLFTLSSALIILLPTLRSIGAGMVSPGMGQSEVVSGYLGAKLGLGDVVSTMNTSVTEAFSACCSRM